MNDSSDKTLAALEASLVDMAIESWRFARLFSRTLNKLDAGEAPRYASQLRYFVKRIEESLQVARCELVNLEGQPYDPGIAATALNIGDFGPDDKLIVEQMLEPIVMGHEGVIRSGTVMLRKVD